MPDIIELETPRLRMRQWRDEDYAPFAEMNADLRVMAFFPAPLSQEESDDLADRIRNAISGRGWGFWALQTRDGGKFIGFTGLNVPASHFPFSPCVEIGWRLCHQAWGKGYASEAALEAMRFGFEELELPEIVSFTAVPNKRSETVMKELGMAKDPDPFEHPDLPKDSPLCRHVLYRLALPVWKMRLGVYAAS